MAFADAFVLLTGMFLATAFWSSSCGSPPRPSPAPRRGGGH